MSQNPEFWRVRTGYIVKRTYTFRSLIFVEVRQVWCNIPFASVFNNFFKNPFNDNSNTFVGQFGLFVLFSKPYLHASSFLIDLAHNLYLLTPLVKVLLVDANAVGPKKTRFVLKSVSQQRSFKIMGNFDGSHASLGGHRDFRSCVTPDVGDGFVFAGVAQVDFTQCAK